MCAELSSVEEELKINADETSSLALEMSRLVSICIAHKEYALSVNAAGTPCLKIDKKQLNRARVYLPLYHPTLLQAASAQSATEMTPERGRDAKALGDDLQEMKEIMEGVENQSIKTIKDTKLKILELLNLSYIKQDFFNNHQKNTDVILKTFLPNLHAVMTKANYQLHPDALLLLMGNIEDSIALSIKCASELLEIIGNKTKSGDEILGWFYDTLIELRNIALKEKEKVVKKIMDRSPTVLQDSVQQDCGVIQQVIIDLINQIVPLVENSVTEQQKVFWKYTDSVECTIPGTPYGRHVKLSVYSMELKSCYDVLMARIEAMKARNCSPERLQLLAMAQLEANREIEALNALSQARAQKILGTKPLKGKLKVSLKNHLAHESIFVAREETQKTFYKVYEIFERLKTIGAELDLKLAAENQLLQGLKPTAKPAVSVASAAVGIEDQKQVVEREGFASPPLLRGGEQANINQSRLCREESPDFQSGVLQQFKIAQQRTIENYRRQIEEKRHQKEEEKRKLSKALQSETKVHMASVKRLRSNLELLNFEELECVLGVLENRKELDYDLTEKVLVKVGFKSSETSFGTKYKFGEHSFSFHKVQAARVKSGMTEIPRDAIRDLRGIFWELGIAKQFILFMQQKIQRKRKSIDKVAGMP